MHTWKQHTLYKCKTSQSTYKRALKQHVHVNDVKKSLSKHHLFTLYVVQRSQLPNAMGCDAIGLASLRGPHRHVLLVQTRNHLKVFVAVIIAVNWEVSGASILTCQITFLLARVIHHKYISGGFNISYVD